MKKYKKVIQEYKFKILAPTQNEDIQDYFEHIIKKHKTFTDNSPGRIYLNKIENRITLKVKTGY